MTRILRYSLFTSVKYSGEFFTAQNRKLKQTIKREITNENKKIKTKMRNCKIHKLLDFFSLDI